MFPAHAGNPGDSFYDIITGYGHTKSKQKTKLKLLQSGHHSDNSISTGVPISRYSSLDSGENVTGVTYGNNSFIDGSIDVDEHSVNKQNSVPRACGG